MGAIPGPTNRIPIRSDITQARAVNSIAACTVLRDRRVLPNRIVAKRTVANTVVVNTMRDNTPNGLPSHTQRRERWVAAGQPLAEIARRPVANDAAGSSRSFSGCC